MTTLTEAELADLEAKCDAATPGEWIDHSDNIKEDEDPVITGAEGQLVVGVIWYNGYHVAIRRADAAFIATARTAVPRLIGELRALLAAQQGRRQVITASERRAMIAVSPEDERLAATSESPEREARLRKVGFAEGVAFIAAWFEDYAASPGIGDHPLWNEPQLGAPDAWGIAQSIRALARAALATPDAGGTRQGGSLCPECGCLESEHSEGECLAAGCKANCGNNTGRF